MISLGKTSFNSIRERTCLLYTSDAADERSSVDLGGRRIIKKKKKRDNIGRVRQRHKEGLRGAETQTQARTKQKQLIERTTAEREKKGT